MSKGFLPCPNRDCHSLVKAWPDQVPFCCHNCWQHFYTTYLRPDLSAEVEGLPKHSDQCLDRQLTRRGVEDDVAV